MGQCQSRNFSRSRDFSQAARAFSQSFDFTEEGSGEEWCRQVLAHCIHYKESKLRLTERGLNLTNDMLPWVNFLQLTHVIELDLSDNKFTTFPQDLCQLSSLKILKFSRNELTSLPADIHKFQTLETLVLDNNDITELSPQIRRLKRLKCLSLENNKLKYLPDELGELDRLQELTVSQNKIAMFPEDLFRPGSRLRKIFANTNELVSLPGSMKHLEKLGRLLLGSNKLRALPHDIGNLEKLTDLWLEDNQLDALPQSMTKLVALQKLKLSNNKLTSLPDFSVCLELEMVYLENNSLESIPDFSNLIKLKVLKLAGNKLTSVHPGIGNLPALKDLSLGDNLLQSVPPELGNLKVNPFSFSLNGNPLVSVPQEVLDLSNVRGYDFPLAQAVCDGLYIGNVGSAKNLRFLEANNITHFVNLAADGPDAPETVKNNEFFRGKQDFVYWSINVADQTDGGIALMRALREGGCLKFMSDSLKAGHRILCHCHKGVSRSATACVAYLVEYKNMSLDDAMAMCKESRQCVKVNAGFMAALQEQYGGAKLNDHTTVQ